MMYKIIMFFWPIVLLLVSPLLGQIQNGKTGEHYFKSIGIKEGLSQSTVLSIYQDHYGYIWLGTRNGLNRYDGHSMKIFRNELNKATSLRGNTINKIQEDTDHNLWIATNEGLNFFNRKTEEFNHYALPEDDVSEILDLVYDKEKLWIACAKGLFLFRTGTLEFERASLHFKSLQPLERQYISALNLHGDTLLVGTNTKGLYQMNISSGNVHPLPLSDEGTRQTVTARINTIYKDRANRLWIGTNGNGLYALNRDGTVTQFSAQSTNAARSITNDNVRSITADEEGNIWAGTFDGLNIISNDGVIRGIRYVDDQPKGLSHSSVRSLLTDRDGSVWIGTYFGGVNIYNEGLQEFKHFRHVSGDRHSLSYDVVGAFAETAAGRLVVGTERDGINIFDEHGEKVLPTGLAKSYNKTIKSLFKASDHTLWAGVFKQGLQRVDTLTGTLIATGHSKDVLSSSIINSITEDKEGKLWLATDDRGGIHRFDPGTMKLQRFINDNALHGQLASSAVKHIYLDQYDILWIATRGKGLLSYHVHNGTIQSYNQIAHLSKDLNAIYEDHSGQIWLATNGNGIIRLSRENGHTTHYHTGDGLLNNIVYSIAEDEAGNIWFSTLTGLSRYTKSTSKFTNFTASAGFPLLELNEGSLFRTSKHQFLIGGNNGFVIFDPMKIQATEKPSPVLITSLHILGQQPQSLYLLSGTKREVVLNYKQPVFSIDYASINYLKPDNIRYAYRLAELDSNWFPMTTNRNVTFSNLPAGKYTFQVRSSIDGNTWVSSDQQVTLRILPAPWLSWWAITAYSMIALSVLLAIRQNELRKRNLKQKLLIEQLEKKRWKEVHDLKLKYFTDVSHEFRTPLTLISGPIEDLVNDAETAPSMLKKLHIVHHNSKRLMLLIDQVLDINRLDEGKISLNETSACIHELLQTIAENFGPLAEKNKVLFKFTANENRGIFLADVDKMEKIVYNLLSNAFKFTPAGGTVALSYRTTKEDGKTWFHIQVADTGRGLHEEEKQRVFDRFYKTDKHDRGVGIGLSLVKSLIDLMGGKIDVASRPSEGSTFEVAIPLRDVPEQVDEHPVAFVKALPTEYEQDVNMDMDTPQQITSGDGELVLVAEDDPAIGNYVAEQLRLDKFKVITANNGSKAWEKAQKYIPDLVITDLRMPIMDGMELCKNLKTNELTSHIPVIILTARTDDQSRIEGLEIGADDYIAKPFHTRELKVRVSNLLTNRKRLQEKFQSINDTVPAKLSINKYDQELLKKIIGIIEHNLSDTNLNVEFIGEKIGMSREHLFRKLKAITGYSPSDFIRNYRLNKAATLLSEKQLKVAEVAFEVGYQDVQYFSKSFKKKFDCSPQQYLKNAFIESN